MTTVKQKTFTLVMPDQSATFGGPVGTGNPPDGFVLTWDAADGYYVARPSIKLKSYPTGSVTSPYTPSTEDIVPVPSHAGTFTINLPNNPLTGTNYFIKDFAGVAGGNQINVATAQLIDGQNPYVINTNFGCILVVFNGTTWSVISKM